MNYNKPRKNHKSRWSIKYKKSINCKNPKGFSQKNYCNRKNRGGKYLENFHTWLKEEEIVAVGKCFPYANNLAMEMVNDGIVNEKEIFICHGEVEEPLARNPKRYVHAWVEAKVLGEERVYDWQMSTARNSMKKEDFYNLFKPSNVVKYTNEQSMINCLKHKHHGPWD
jgi:hypothetical protein